MKTIRYSIIIIIKISNIYKYNYSKEYTMKSKIIQQGAEAIITLEEGDIVKSRVKKSYRLNELDERLRKSRTKSEAKIIKKLKDVILVPRIIETDEKEKIVMEFIDGRKLSGCLEELDWRNVCKQIGKSVGRLHDMDIVHGDLTTSNMILKDDKVYFIDFGLGFHSHKVEDKAVDLHLLKQALEAKHFNIAEEAFAKIIQGYRAQKHKEIIQRIQIIESRGRYKEKH